MQGDSVSCEDSLVLKNNNINIPVVLKQGDEITKNCISSVEMAFSPSLRQKKFWLIF